MSNPRSTNKHTRKSPRNTPVCHNLEIFRRALPATKHNKSFSSLLYVLEIVGDSSFLHTEHPAVHWHCLEMIVTLVCLIRELLVATVVLLGGNKTRFFPLWNFLGPKYHQMSISRTTWKHTFYPLHLFDDLPG